MIRILTAAKGGILRIITSSIKQIILYFCLVLITCDSKAQDSLFEGTDQNVEQDFIRWVGQYPDMDPGNNASLKSKLVKIVFGEKTELLRKPVNVIAFGPEHFWILDQGNGTLVENRNGSGKIPNAIRKRNELFQSLVGMCFLPGEELLFTDSRQGQIYRFIPGRKDLKLFNDTISLQQPTGIAYCLPTAEIWVVETAAHRISVLNKDGELVKRIGARGNAEGEFNFPTHIWIDRFGKVYIVDSMNFRIQVFNSNGDFLLSFGEAGGATGYFARPKGIATDFKGNIYIADALFHVIQIFDREGNFLYYFGTQGQGEGQFWMPAGIFIDSDNYIYIADSYNTRIQIFKLINEDMQ